MHIRDFRPAILRAAEGAGSAAPATDTPPPADPPPPADVPPPPAEPKWHERETFAAMRPWLEAKGMTGDDPLAALDRAVRVAMGAEKLLGRGPEKLMERPAKDADLAEWMRANGEIFGVPDAPDKYTIERPDLPADMPWNDALEAEVRAVAHRHALPPAALQDLVASFAGSMSKAQEDLAAQAQAAEAEIMGKLEKDWGETAKARVEAARGAVSALAEKAGLSAEGVSGVMQSLEMKLGVGDPGIIRLFATIGEMMGEDSLKGGGAGASAGFAMSPAEARAKLAAMDARDGEFGKAFRSGNRAEMDRLMPSRKNLQRIAAG